VSRPTLGPSQSSIQSLPAALSSGIKRPGREADHSPPSSAEVKNDGAIPPLPHMSSMAQCLVKQRDRFTFYCKRKPICISDVGDFIMASAFSLNPSNYSG
jgi:hypothetical protein